MKWSSSVLAWQNEQFLAVYILNLTLYVSCSHSWMILQWRLSVFKVSSQCGLSPHLERGAQRAPSQFLAKQAVSAFSFLTKYLLSLKEKLWLKVHQGTGSQCLIKTSDKNMSSHKAVSNLKKPSNFYYDNRNLHRQYQERNIT